MKGQRFGAGLDVDMLQEVLSGVRMSPLATTLPGEWSCRTLKLGGGDQTILPSRTLQLNEGGILDLNGTVAHLDGAVGKIRS